MGRGKISKEINMDFSELIENVEDLKNQTTSLLGSLDDVTELVGQIQAPPLLTRLNAALTTRDFDTWQISGNNAIAIQNPEFLLPLFSVKGKISQPGEYVEFNAVGKLFFGLASEVQEPGWTRMNGGFYCRQPNDLRFSLKGDWGKTDPARTVLQEDISLSRFRLLISAETELSWQIQDSSSGEFLTRYSYKPCFYGTLFPFGVGGFSGSTPAPELFDVVIGKYV